MTGGEGRDDGLDGSSLRTAVQLDVDANDSLTKISGL